MRLVPGDIAEILVYQTGSESSTVQKRQIQQIRRELGLDRPVVTQYLDWIGGAVSGAFAPAHLRRRPGVQILQEGLPPAAEPAAPATPTAAGWPHPPPVLTAGA